MKQIKHVGKIKETGRRIILITSRIPGKEDHALVVDTDSLRDAYLNSLMDVVELPEAQKSNDLGSVLMRIPSPENGVTWLMSLHKNNLLVPTPISSIIMYPTPSDPIELKYAIKLMDGEDFNTVMKEKEENDISSDTLHSFPDIIKSRDGADKEVIAMNLITEATRFELEAKRKFEEAYKIAPHLRPAPAPTPVIMENAIEENIVENDGVYSVEIAESVTDDDIQEFISEFKEKSATKAAPKRGRRKKSSQ